MKNIRFTTIFFSTATSGLLMLGCVNETAEVEKVTYDDNSPVESTYNSQIFYSENADLKVKAFATEMHRYVGETDYIEMPKGIEVIFYDSINQESSKLTANYAIDKQTEFIMEAMDDVVVINAEGERLNTEHLIWDRKTRRIYSEKFVTITTEDEIIMGDGFESNETFTKYKITKSRGVISQDDEESN